MESKTLWHKKEITTDKKAVIVHKPDNFNYKTAIDIRFADFDMMGHVNNVTYFTYLEIARTKYWQAIMWDWEQTGVIVANASLDYISPVYPKDQLMIYVRTSRIGNSSFDLDYLLVKHTINNTEEICAVGKTVCVAFDYKTKKPIPIPETERSRMMNFEQL